ncbi:type II toxin-antitoxin system RelE/ParE family toxin [Pontibacter sp. 172403-2]|uniref:type II toxin-antitoxin system RelE/ParE family toxin n=1 Tax=Pontibacter rufus TaxID=2791028 RepID=UPI0018AF9012|nr:type II toxin-antitoxin system RelE/ParE family toxin [Pontibacter sp. 172403-2]
MKNGYKIVWTNLALSNLDNIIEYLTNNWTETEISKFFRKIDRRISLISQRPLLYPLTSNRENVRRSVLSSQITIYYRINKQSVEILTLFDNRQNPSKLAV